ncbi:MAG: hypothetical protein ACP5NV_05510 [Candidatus Woesearchaeota archaeon]
MKKTLLIMFLFMAAFVSAAYSLTNLSLEGEAGTFVNGVVTLSGTGTRDQPITLESTDLTSGSNTIDSSKISITPLNSDDALIGDYSVRVSIPQNQQAGVYTGNIKVFVDGSFVTQNTLTVTVESGVNPGTSIALTEVSLGSNDQARDETIDGTLEIRNTGTNPVVLTLTNSLDDKYELTLSQSTVSLASGQTASIEVGVYVPEDQDSGIVNIGKITATGNGIVQSANVLLETKSELEITKVRLDIDGDTESADDGDEVDANAGDDVTLTVTVRNNFDDSIDIEDVEVEIESDSDLDWDDTDDIGDISDGDREEIEFSFSIDSDIDEDEYDVEVRVEGEDENGAMHEHSITFTVNIDKENHEITITSATLNPTRLSCDARTVTVRTNIENTGSNDEDDVSIVVENDELGVYEYDTRLEIDEDDDLDKSFTFTVPKNARIGEYDIHVTSYYDNDRESDEKVLSLFIDPCVTTTTVNTTTTGTPGNNGGNNIQPIVYPTGTTGPTYGSASFFNSPVYVVILVIAVLIFLVLITLLLVKFVF